MRLSNNGDKHGRMRKPEFNKEVRFLIISCWRSRSSDLISGRRDLFGRQPCLVKLFLSRPVIDFTQTWVFRYAAQKTAMKV